MRKQFLLGSLLLAVLALVIAPALAQDAEPTTVHVRVAHFSPDTPAVDVYLNGDLSPITGLEFPTVTDWVELPAGTYNVAVAPAETSLDDAAIGPADVDLPAGAWITVAAVGSLANGTLKPAVLVEDYSDIPAGSARVSVFHAVEGAPAVDVRANGEAIIRSLAFPGSRGDNDGFITVTVPSNAYDFQAVPFGRGEPVLLDLPGAFVQSGVNYLGAIVGTPDEPQVVITATDPTTGKAPELLTVGNLVATIGDLSTLANLGGSAYFSGGLATLNQKGPFTLFAPTNEAFDALRRELGLAAFNAIADNPGSAGTRYIILYHVVPGTLMAADIGGATELSAATGEPITVTSRDGKVFLNDKVELETVDIPASNGVLHLIKGVLVPPSE
ncbi:MAG: DUF4397 domain-containing protein [Chloroflexi bacterium]|nr:DUF4397 domain-containing protein [Chloroflexota bacterium]